MNKSILSLLIAILVVGTGLFLYIALQTPSPQTELELVAETPTMSFFVTSTNPGTGGNLGGVKGADAYCAQLAEAAGVMGKTWRAYLSSGATLDNPVVHARDRIGNGPWYNAKGVLIAKDVSDLHGPNTINKQTALNEKGEEVWGRGDTINTHDILTGSTAEGLLATGESDTTCNNWSSNSEGSAVVGHHDRIGINDTEPMKSWNSSHGTRGCSMEAFKSTGGAGLFYCFAQ